jgi:hypothetical protein
MLAGFQCDKPVVLEMRTKQILLFEVSIKLHVYFYNMDRDGLVGIATVYWMECRCVRDITHLFRPAHGPNQNNLQRITDNFRL